MYIPQITQCQYLKAILIFLHALQGQYPLESLTIGKKVRQKS